MKTQTKTQGARLEAEGVKPSERKTPTKTPSEIFRSYLQGNFCNYQEKFEVIVFDQALNFVRRETIGMGSIANVNIDVATLFRVVLLSAGNRFILAHNHPSGNPEPSAEDISFTKHIIKCADMLRLDFLDHIIYTDSDFLSLREKGLF